MRAPGRAARRLTSAGDRSGAHSRAVAATSHSGAPGAARSKSINAIARPSRNTKLSRLGSLCSIPPVSWGGGGRCGQVYGDGSNPAAASWNRLQQLPDAPQRRIGEPPRRRGRDHGVARDVAQHLPPLRVDAEHARRSVEPHVLQVPQQRVHTGRRRPQRAAHGVPDAVHLAAVGGAAEQGDLGPHPGTAASICAASMRASASVECVTRLLTYPPRTAANTARDFANP